MTKYISLIILGITFSLGLKAQVPSPAPAQSEPIAIIKGTAHIGNGQVVENAVVLFNNGKIESVDTYDPTFDYSLYQIIDAEGKDVYPGLILPLTKLGLEEVAAVRATRDYSEVGSMKPHVRTAIAFNTDSEIIPTMKFNGIQIAQIAPAGGRVEGTSSIMQLDAWNWEDALYKENDGVHMNWPSITTRARWWLGETERKANDKYQEQVEAVKSLFDDTKSYMELKPETTNLMLEAMAEVINGNRTLFIYVNRPQEIIEAIQMSKEFGVPNVVLAGCEDVWPVADLVKESGYPVLLENVHRRPNMDDQDINHPFKLAAMLSDKGILVGLTYVSGMLASARNLPFFAGTVAAYGADREEALSMITLNTAKILRIDELTGSLEAGKDANIVISTGDILDMRTNNVEYSFIQGREVDLEALQQRLYQKYKEKYEAKK
ncbi:MAG: amidohydrolase family protein [Cyclobacteriaceae bacterium]